MLPFPVQKNLITTSQYADGKFNVVLSSQLPSFDPVSGIQKCQHPALQFIGCDLYNPQSESNFGDITIAVIDNGLVAAQWEFLEQNPFARVDIIRYVYQDENGIIREYGGDWKR